MPWQFGIGNLNYRHGKTKSPEYKVWSNMFARCTNSNHPRYADWGGRGIAISESWQTFEKFYKDMGNRPSQNHTLERKNNKLGYSKTNCYWATPAEQALNRRSNLYLSYAGVCKTAKEWAQSRGINYVTLVSRKRRGWSDVEAILGERDV
jgi:hypothetical protein